MARRGSGSGSDGYIGRVHQCRWLIDNLLNCFASCLADALAEAREGRVVLGVGINVNIPEEQLPQEVDVPATSLLVETGREVDRAELLVELLARLERRYDAWVVSPPG